MSRMAASFLYNERIQTRILQTDRALHALTTSGASAMRSGGIDVPVPPNQLRSCRQGERHAVLTQNAL